MELKLYAALDRNGYVLMRTHAETMMDAYNFFNDQLSRMGREEYMSCWTAANKAIREVLKK
jgi:hypothetical protein